MNNKNDRLLGGDFFCAKKSHSEEWLDTAS